MDFWRVAGVWRCVFYMHGSKQKNSWPDVLVCNCGCGVWLCGRSEKNCHVAFPFRSHLLREECLFVCLPQTVTAWQLPFHQSQQRGGKLVVWRKCTTVFLACTCSYHRLPILACALTIFSECVKYKNSMKPNGGTRLQYVNFYSLRWCFDGLEEVES